MDETAARFWEVDSLRGIAIIMMILFHFLCDISYFGAYDVNVGSGFWYFFAKATATVFIFLVGVSMTLRYAQDNESKTPWGQMRLKYIRRGLQIFGLGLIITVMTYLYLQRGFIIFGILHFIGIATIITHPMVKHRYANLLISAAAIPLGLYLLQFTFDFPWLLWLGFTPKHFYTLDYFPLLPWLGILMLGIYFGNSAYPNGVRKFWIKNLSESAPVRLLSFLGRNSLLTYLIHQPILILFLYAFVL